MKIIHKIIRPDQEENIPADAFIQSRELLADGYHVVYEVPCSCGK